MNPVIARLLWVVSLAIEYLTYERLQGVAGHGYPLRVARALLMTVISPVLLIAVEDNIAWCSRVCSNRSGFPVVRATR